MWRFLGSSVWKPLITLSSFCLFCVDKGACPNEQGIAAEQHSGRERNKCHPYSGSCQRLTAGSSAGARRPWGWRQSCASQQAEQKELTHGSQQWRVPSAQGEEQHGCEKVLLDEQKAQDMRQTVNQLKEENEWLEAKIILLTKGLS